MIKHYPSGRALTALALACTVAIAPPAQALEYRLTAGVNSTHTDNVGRASDESGLKQDDWVHRPSLLGTLEHDTGRLRARANYMVEHRIYTEDVFNDRTRFTGRADLRWDALPDLLEFNISNSSTESTEDSLGQDIETNRQTSNVTSAGPRLYFRPRSSDTASIEYQYSDIRTEETSSDSTRHLLAADYELGLSANRSLLFEVSREMVEFDDTSAPELDIDTASLAYLSKGDYVELEARAGYTRVDRNLNRDKVDGVIGNMRLLWRVSGSGQIEVTGSRTINDQSANVLRGNAEFGQGSVFENTDVNEVFTEDIARVRYTHRWGRNTASIAYNLQNKDYDDDAFAPGQSRDEEESGFTVFYTRRLTPRMDFRMGGGLLERDFQDRGVKEDYLTGDLRIDWRAGRRLTLFGGASYEDRDGSGIAVLADQISFSEFAFTFGLTFDIVNRAQQPQQF